MRSPGVAAAEEAYVSPDLIYHLRTTTEMARHHAFVLQMGPSGSGKTTLLDVLAGRKTVGHIDGTIRFNGQRPSANFLSHHTGYVEQSGKCSRHTPDWAVHDFLVMSHRRDNSVA